MTTIQAFFFFYHNVTPECLFPTLSQWHGTTRPSRSLPRGIVTFLQNNYLNSDLTCVVPDYMRPVIFCPHVFNPPGRPRGVKTADKVFERGNLIFRLSHTDSLLHQPKVLRWNPFFSPTADKDE